MSEFLDDLSARLQETTRQILLRELQRYQNCALCGKSVGPYPSCVDRATGNVIHERCEP